MNRDNCRTPMQWDTTANAGFTSPTAKPWLAVSKNYPQVNVETELADENSILNTYREILKLRNDHSAFQEGSLEIVADYKEYPDLLVFRRYAGGKSLAVFLLWFRENRNKATCYSKNYLCSNRCSYHFRFKIRTSGLQWHCAWIVIRTVCHRGTETQRAMELFQLYSCASSERELRIQISCCN